jgi:hypothetical protein
MFADGVVEILTNNLFTYVISFMATFQCIWILCLTIDRFLEKKKFNVYEEGCKNPIRSH